MFTILEKKVLDALIGALFAEPGFSDVSPGDLSELTALPMKVLRGILGSLSAKKVVYMDKSFQDVTIVHLTEEFYHLHPTWGKGSQ
jgi:hypothetical protein